MGKTVKIITCLLLLFAAVFTAAGQVDSTALRSVGNRPQVRARFVPDSIAIGDRFALEVEVTQDIMQVVDFPVFKDNKLGEIIEIVSEGAVDTLKRDGRRVTVGRKYTLQTFEDGYYGLGRFPLLYADKNIIDTIWSTDSLRLKVATFEVDTATQTIYDIKPPVKVPFKVGEVSGYALWGLLALAIIGVLLWYIFTRRRNLSLLGKPKPVEPPHVKAIKALEAVHNQKLWQNDKHKLYYTRITDILREYLEGRYSIRAMEMTTDEIIKALETRGLPEKNYTGLADMLRNSDFVKFAQYIPGADANEEFYTKAYYFIEDTKPEEVEPMPEEAKEQQAPWER